MSKTRLYSEKAKSKHGVYGDDFNDYPFKVKKYYDRHCGNNDNKVENYKRKINKIKKNLKDLEII